MYAQRPHDADLLIPAIEIHAAKLGRVPRLVAADSGFFPGQNQAAAKAKGVKRACIPNHGTKSTSRQHERKKRWVSATGSDGVADARDASVSAASERCRYRSDDGCNAGPDADNLINIGRFVAAQPAT